MKSMTGYAYQEFQNDEVQLLVEVKSYNNRYLDMTLNIPAFLNPLEPEIRSLIKGTVLRGHVDVTIRLRRLSIDSELYVDKDAVLKYKQSFQEIAQIADIDETLRLSHFMHLDDIIKPVKNQDIEKYAEIIIPMLQEVTGEHEETRRKEGELTRKDIVTQLTDFRQSLEDVKNSAMLLEDRIKTTLLEKFEELLGKDYDENRFMSEVAVLMVKYSVNEEIQRIESHLHQFEAFLEEKNAVGKKIDFLCQELNREINTLASKSSMVEVNQAVVVMKDRLENIREQLRNVE